MSDSGIKRSDLNNYTSLYRRQFFKTSFCRYFMENRCAKGAFCEHAHSDAELIAKPVLTKTRMCKQLLRSSFCSSGELCPYAHDSHEVAKSNSFYKSKLCEFISREGGCKVGEACRYAHSVDEVVGPLTTTTCAPALDLDDSPDDGYPLKRGNSTFSTMGSFSSFNVADSFGDSFDPYYLESDRIYFD